MRSHWMSLLLLWGGLWLAGCGAPQPELSHTNPSDGGDAANVTIWWTKGFYFQEDEALEQLIQAWEAETGYQVELTLISQDDILKEAENALEQGEPPDLFFSNAAEEMLIPRWAWQGQLRDVTAIVAPLERRYSPAAFKSASLYNAQTNARSIYAVPVLQRTVHVHYWRDLLAEAGFSDADIPTEWDAFWHFWQDVQTQLRSPGNAAIYGLGLPMSSEASDTYSAFEQVLEAYDVELLDTTGQLQIQAPEIRQGIIDALTWYTQFYQAGVVPPAATNWTNGDNNDAFLNRQVVMTVNPTLSIPGAQREDETTYREQLVTIELPNEPDGESAQYLVAVKQAVIFATANQPEAAQEFLTYLLEPDNLGAYLEGSLGRYFPVMPEILDQPFWTDPNDPHIAMATQVFAKDGNQANYQALNPAYSQVKAQNIWGIAIEQIVVDQVSPAQAADTAIAAIEQIFQTWQ